MLSPMSGYTDSPYRRVVKELNPDILCITELVSADGIVYNPEKGMKMISHHEVERPLIVQLFGKKKDFFVQAAREAIKSGAAGIDINMGCPARKVTHAGHGSTLIKMCDTAFEIVKAVTEEVNVPVSVKTRLGWTDDSGLQMFVKGLIEAGAKAITIHGRTVNQRFDGVADWQPIYDLKKFVVEELGRPDVPVFGNGDVLDVEDGMEKLGNLDGFMIGRAAMGNPWVFVDRSEVPKSVADKRDVILKHAEYMVEFFGEETGVKMMRKFLTSYISGFPGVKGLREKMVRVATMEDVKNVVEEALEVEKGQLTMI